MAPAKKRALILEFLKVLKSSNDGHDGLMVAWKMIDRQRGTIIERRVRRQLYIDGCRGVLMWLLPAEKKSRMMAWWLGGTSRVESLDF